MSGDVLSRIAEAVRDRLEREPVAPGLARRALEAAGARRRGGGRSLLATLRRPGVRIIAECKQRSPSAGVLRSPFEPVGLARAYQAGGAAAISVVTEPEYFGGQSAWVGLVRGQVRVPVLQKDFFLGLRQLQEAVVLGADAVLLIVRILPDALLREMTVAAQELGLETVLEIHNLADLERALTVPGPIVGVNARDLRTFEVNLDAAAALALRVPDDRLALVESGISGPDSVRALTARGLNCFLIGEYLLLSGDPDIAVAELTTCD
ncbi:MAG: trpC [Acidobacteria bacterium]|nr:trpC [Acidobacteriota bacterium]